MRYKIKPTCNNKYRVMYRKGFFNKWRYVTRYNDSIHTYWDTEKGAQTYINQKLKSTK